MPICLCVLYYSPGVNKTTKKHVTESIVRCTHQQAWTPFFKPHGTEFGGFTFWTYRGNFLCTLTRVKHPHRRLLRGSAPPWRSWARSPCLLHRLCWLGLQSLLRYHHPLIILILTLFLRQHYKYVHLSCYLLCAIELCHRFPYFSCLSFFWS